MANGATYVSPRPAIKLKGAPNDDMVTSLLDIAVRAPEAGMASAEIRMVNWGTQPSAPVNFLFNTVAIGDKIEIAFGLAQQKTVFSGEVTAIEERYGDGVPQIVLLAEDALHRLARHRISRPFVQQSPNSIVQTLASDAGLQADAKLSDTPGDYNQLNVLTQSDKAAATEEPFPWVMIRMPYDLDLLAEEAAGGVDLVGKILERLEADLAD